MKITPNLATPSSAVSPLPFPNSSIILCSPLSFLPLLTHHRAQIRTQPITPRPTKYRSRRRSCATVKKSLKAVRAGAGAMETPQRMIQRLGRQCYALLCLGIVLLSVAVARYVYGPVEAEDRRGREPKLNLQKSQS